MMGKSSSLFSIRLLKIGCNSVLMTLLSCGGNPVGVAPPDELRFQDSFNRAGEDNWGSPDLGSGYTYINHDNASFVIVSNVGYIDDNSNTGDPRAVAQFTATSSSYRIEYKWKYSGGRGSGIFLYYGESRRIGLIQEDADTMLRFCNGASYEDIEQRSTDTWNSYRIEVNGSTARIYVNNNLRLTTDVVPSPVDNIHFWAQGNGNPSDSWYDDVLLYSSFISE